MGTCGVVPLVAPPGSDWGMRPFTQRLRMSPLTLRVQSGLATVACSNGRFVWPLIHHEECTAAYEIAGNAGEEQFRAK